METELKELILNEARAYCVFAKGELWDHRFAISLRCDQFLDSRFNRTYVFPSTILTAAALEQISRDVIPVPLPFRMDMYLPIPGDTKEFLRQKRFKLTENYASEMILKKVPSMPGKNRKVKVERVTQDLVESFTTTFLNAYQAPSDLFGLARSILLQTIPKAFNHEGALLYLAYLDSKPVGVAYLFSEDGVGGIYNVGVLPEARKKGVAEALMLRAIEDCRSAGNTTLCLQTRADSFQERFYARLGFTTVAHRDRAIQAQS